MRRLKAIRSLCIVYLLLAACFSVVVAQVPAAQNTGAIDESKVVTLLGNVHPMALAQFDQGQVSEELQLNRMVLLLTPSAGQQQELDALLEAQHDPSSPLFHQWLTPAQYGARFGASGQTQAQVVQWLQSHGFKIDEIPASHQQIVFSGTEAQLENAFHTEIHYYRANGAMHMANAQDPQIPAAFAGVVSGVLSLHDFRRTSAITSPRSLGAPQADGVLPQYTSGNTHYLFPGDWATIYDLNPLYNAGTTGSGSSIAIAGRSNINLSDVAGFRSISGLQANQPTVILAGANPGLVSGDQNESTLDVEWAGAVAPAASVKLIVGASTTTTDGVDLAAMYAVNNATAKIVSVSYGSCEQDMGSTEMAFYNSLWQQAASEGISAFVSSGDAGAAGCYSASATSASSAGVNGLCSSPYSTCVGGTEFNEGSSSSQYWSSTNSASYASALSYIPEVVWNESGSNGGSGLWASGGGISRYYTQPSWQKGITGASASNGMRAVPDVALAAAAHDGYLIEENGEYYLVAGTSAAAPSFAGLMALVVQSKGGSGQGNANPALYALLDANTDPFHATPSGNNSVPGVAGFTASGGSYNLATGLGSVDGALLVENWSSASSKTSVDFALTASAAKGTVLAGKSITFTLTASETGTAKNAIALIAKAPTGVTVSFSSSTLKPGATVTVTVAASATVAAGAQSITITGSDSTGTGSLAYALTVQPAPVLTLSVTSASLSIAQGGTVTDLISLAGNSSYSGAATLSISGLPSGVSASWSVNPVAMTLASGASTLKLTASSSASPGTNTVTISATGGGLTISQKITLAVISNPTPTLTVTPAVATMSVATPVQAVSNSQTAASQVIAFSANSSFTGSVSLSASGLPSGLAATWSSNPVTLTSAKTGSSTLTVTALAATSTRAAVAPGSYTLTLTAAGSGLKVIKTIQVQVDGVVVTPASATLTIHRGMKGTLSVRSTPMGGASGPVQMGLSAASFPSGVTVTASPASLPAPGSGATTFTFTVSSGAASGSYSVSAYARVLANAASSTPLYIGWSSSPVTLNIVP
jgi:uncharacterized membrane protein